MPDPLSEQNFVVNRNSNIIITLKHLNKGWSHVWWLFDILIIRHEGCVLELTIYHFPSGLGTDYFNAFNQYRLESLNLQYVRSQFWKVFANKVSRLGFRQSLIYYCIVLLPLQLEVEYYLKLIHNLIDYVTFFILCFRLWFMN